MKRFKLRLSTVLFLFVLFSSNQAFSTQQIVKLKKCPCSSGSELKNKSVIENAIKSNVILQLPEGSFSSDSIDLKDVENFTLKGSVKSGTNEINTKLKILKSTGISVSNATNIRLENIEIEGNTGSNLVELKNAGDLSAENILLKKGSATKYEECLRPDLDWLVPVISLILY
ncbi:MAG: hypothetical protein GY714_31895 [Desulfobacterales bacterium]|nr:hypothetical protein [Desulfobacterales bacterium]